MGLRQCVNEMCKQCIYDTAVPGTWRDQVEKCGCENCPLFSVRPLTMATVNRQRKAKKEKNNG